MIVTSSPQPRAASARPRARASLGAPRVRRFLIGREWTADTRDIDSGQHQRRRSGAAAFFTSMSIARARKLVSRARVGRAMRDSLLVAVVLQAAFITAASAAATPVCRVRARPFLEGRVRGDRSTPQRAVDARAGEEVAVFLALPGTLDGKHVVFGESGAADRVSWTRAGCPTLAIAWRRVEPRMQHEETDSPNETTDVYSNAVMFGPRHGRWVGFDAIEYFETAVP